MVLFLIFMVLFLLSSLSQIIFSNLFDLIFFNNFLIILWSLIIASLVYTNNKNNTKYHNVFLYIKGVFKYINMSSFFLIYNNIKLLYSFLKYNVNDFVLFIPKIQTWVPLFRRGGYLLLLNSSKTRWQLSKSNSIFKNK